MNKLSKYIFSFKSRDGYCIFNTNNGSLLFLENSEGKTLKKYSKNVDKMPAEMFKTLNNIYKPFQAT